MYVIILEKKMFSMEDSMPDNSEFFLEQTEQSAIKAHIVASYFAAWARVIQKWNSPMVYMDLFCGPGRYGDDNFSAPLLIVKEVLSSRDLTSKMEMIFNDQDRDSIVALKSEIDALDIENALKRRIAFYNLTIDQDFCDSLRIPENIPILSFVDPFGYKGLSLNLIDKLISNNGSDCIFFFNYNRINMALSNYKFDEHLKGLFGEERTHRIKRKLVGLSPDQRERLIIQSLIDALRERKGHYVLPFKFYSVGKTRTSHFIIFVSKHPIACSIMKSILYTNSAKDIDGIASFSYEDHLNFSNCGDQMSFFETPMQVLMNDICELRPGSMIKVKDLCDQYDSDITTCYVGKNVKDALRRLESEEKIEVIEGRKIKQRAGILNMPDNAIIKIL